MKETISNAKVAFSKAIQSAQCRIEIFRAVVVCVMSMVRLKKLHPVRHATKRENVCYSLRSSRLTLKLATEKLKSI